MLKHNLESDPAEGYELVQVISEDKGKENSSLWVLPYSEGRGGPVLHHSYMTDAHRNVLHLSTLVLISLIG